MEVFLKNGALHCRFLLMFALFDPPPAPFPAPSWSQAGPGRSSGMCISHVGAHARARARARSPNSVFAVKGGEEEEGVLYPPLSQTLSKENSIPTYQRYVGMLKLKDRDPSTTHIKPMQMNESGHGPWAKKVMALGLSQNVVIP